MASLRGARKWRTSRPAGELPEVSPNAIINLRQIQTVFVPTLVSQGNQQRRRRRRRRQQQVACESVQVQFTSRAGAGDAMGRPRARRARCGAQWAPAGTGHGRGHGARSSRPARTALRGGDGGDGDDEFRPGRSFADRPETIFLQRLRKDFNLPSWFTYLTQPVSLLSKAIHTEGHLMKRARTTN